VNAWKVILATVVIFLTGIVTGGLLVRYVESPFHSERPARPGQPSPSSALRMDFLKRMNKELDLSPEQRQRIDKLLKEHQENIKKILEPVQPEIHEEVLLAKDEFLEELTPAQRARFEEKLKEQEKAKQPKPAPAPRPLPTNAPPAAAFTNRSALTNQ
jgi:hypothetical protein